MPIHAIASLVKTIPRLRGQEHVRTGGQRVRQVVNVHDRKPPAARYNFGTIKRRASHDGP